MFMSRQLEETRKTKFKKGREEDIEKSKKKQKPKRKLTPNERRGFDMWEDQPDEGC